MSAINQQHLQLAIRTACAMTLATYLSAFLHFDAPYWAVISVVTIMNPYVGATLKKGFFRIIATVFGAFLGVALANLNLSNVVSFLFVIFCVTFITYYFVNIARYSYAFLLTGVTFLFVFGSLALGPNQPGITAAWRTTEITLGVICGALVTLILFPKDAITDMWQHISQALIQCKNILKESLKGDDNSGNIAKLDSAIKKISQHADAFSQELDSNHNQYSTIQQLITNLTTLQQHWIANRIIYKNLGKITWLNNFELPLQDILDKLADYFEQLSITSSNQMLANNIATIEHYIAVATAKYDRMRQNGDLMAYPHQETRSLGLALQSIHTIFKQTQAIHRSMINLQSHHESNLVDKPFFITKPNANTFKQCTKMALSVTLAMAIWLQSNWPGGLQGLISAFIVGMPTYITDLKRVALLRLFGATLGAAVGLLTLTVIKYNITDLLIVIFIFGTVFSYITFNSPHYGYIGLQANIALALCLVQAGGPPTTITPALMRLSGIVLGIGSTLAVAYLLWPQKPSTIYQKLTRTICNNLPGLMRTIFIEDTQKEVFQKKLQSVNSIISDCQQAFTAVKIDWKISEEIQTYYQQQLKCFRQLIQLLTSCQIDIGIAAARCIAKKHQLNLDNQINCIIKCVDQYCAATSSQMPLLFAIDFETFQQRNYAIGQQWRELRQQTEKHNPAIVQLFGLLHYLERILMILLSATESPLEPGKPPLYNQTPCPGGTTG